MQNVRNFFMFFAILVLCGTLSTSAQNPAAREIHSLDGEWDFTAGEQSGKINVPGIWNNQGYGPENDKVKFNFVGVGHYSRTISVPETWNGRSIFLVLTGISRYATVRVDGKTIGNEAIGCIGSHEWDLTDALKPGKSSRLEIDVDSRQRWGVDPMLGAAQLNDYMLIVWGGIWGHASLEVRNAPYITNLFIKTDLKFQELESEIESKHESEIKSEIKSNPEQKSTKESNSESESMEAGTLCTAECTAEFQLAGHPGADSVRFDIYEFPSEPDSHPIVTRTESLTSSKSDSEKNAQNNDPIQILRLTLPEARLWSPDAPNLYTAKVTLFRNGKEIDSTETRFGVREIRFEGMKVFLNNKQIFLCGYGDDHIYPYEYSMSCDKNMYTNRLRLIKKFGFNYVRHHSTILPHEYYEACDEVGMLVNAEFLLGYPQQLPGWGPLWKAGNTENLPPEAGNKLLIERFGRVICEYRNHPSIFAWVFGNELNMGPPWLEMPLRNQAFQTAKSLDATRPFMDLDGDWRKAIEQSGRDTSDFYSVLFDEWANPVTTPQKFDLSDLGKPAIAHEMGNYLTFSRPDQIDLFEGTAFKPFWMTEGKAKLEKMGLLDEVEGWALASERLYCFLHKSGIETLRKNPRLSGYHWWLIQDYWTTSNGLVDLFFRPKSITPEEVRQFNAPTVLLVEGLNRSYRSGESMNLAFRVSNFSSSNLKGTLKLSFEFSGETKTFSYPVCGARIGEVTQLAELTVPVPFLTVPESLRISASFLPTGASEPIQQNAWTTRLFPEKIAQSADLSHVFADESIRRSFPSWNFQPIPESASSSEDSSSEDSSSEPLPAEAVYLVSWLDPEILDALKRGANCVLLGSPECLPTLRLTYKQTWWKAGDSENQNITGTYVYDDPILSRVVTDHWCDGAWCELLDGAVKFGVEQAPVTPQTLIRGLPSLVLVQDTPILFRVRVGQGILTVSGLNHTEVGETPLNEWLIHEMLLPVQEKEQIPGWPMEFLQPKIEIPEGLNPGFRRLISTSEETFGPAFYAPGAVMFVCRQTNPENVVTWQTAKAKNFLEDPQGQTPKLAEFFFVGGMGWLSQPDAGGFELLVNDSSVLRFNLPPAETKKMQWQSEDGSVTLRFEVEKVESNGQDFLGRFFLTLPANMLESGAAQITVRSTGSGSSRWFSLNPMASFK